MKSGISRVLEVIAAVLVASCGGGGGGGGDGAGSGTDPATNGTASPSPTLAATATIGAEGGSVGLTDGTRVDIAAGALAAPALASVSRDSSEASAGDFSNASSIFGPVIADASALVVSVDAGSMPDGSVSVSLPIQDEMASLAAAGRQLTLFSTRLYELDGDDDKSEATELVQATALALDAQARRATAVLPANAFDSRTGKLLATLRIAALPADESIEGSPPALRAGNSLLKQLPRTTPLACPGDASFTAPLLYGWRDVPDPGDYYDTIGGIIGPFAEQAGHSGGTGHGGVDFFADIGTPVYAVANGYVERVQHQHWDCADDAGTAKRSQAPVFNGKDTLYPHPLYTLTLAVTDANGAVVDRVRYLHLAMDSVRIRGTESDPDFAKCWVERNPKNPAFRVDANDLLAATGNTGTAPNHRDRVGPHLHLEWRPGRANEVRNPMCKLATIFPSQFEGAGSGNLAELAYRMYGWAPPGLASRLPGFQIGDSVEFWVRRQKPAGATTPCLQNFGPHAVTPCDWGGRGAFYYPLAQALQGQWELFSRAEVARVDVAPASLLQPDIFHLDAEGDRITQMPRDVGVFIPIGTSLAFSSSCPSTTDWDWSVSLPFTTDQARARFGPVVKMRHMLVQEPNAPTICNAVDTQLSPQ